MVPAAIRLRRRDADLTTPPTAAPPIEPFVTQKRLKNFRRRRPVSSTFRTVDISRLTLTQDQAPRIILASLDDANKPHDYHGTSQPDRQTQSNRSPGRSHPHYIALAGPGKASAQYSPRRPSRFRS
jgi:hypothetical protein